ncbi:group 1 truncated hemoglobin [bacterium]|jgi:truncated hemoglobin YjbI|nr:group 1 truncated hemoglobin [bacterium]
MASSASRLQPLFKKLGGEPGLSQFLRDFYDRMSRDVLIGFFFDGKDTAAIADKQKQFLMKAMGESKTYSGKNPSNAHLELPPILRGHFDRRLRILEETLKDHGLDADEIHIWIEFEKSFRAVIEAKPS